MNNFSIEIKLLLSLALILVPGGLAASGFTVLPKFEWFTKKVQSIYIFVVGLIFIAGLATHFIYVLPSYNQ